MSRLLQISSYVSASVLKYPAGNAYPTLLYAEIIPALFGYFNFVFFCRKTTCSYEGWMRRTAAANATGKTYFIEQNYQSIISGFLAENCFHLKILNFTLVFQSCTKSSIAYLNEVGLLLRATFVAHQTNHSIEEIAQMYRVFSGKSSWIFRSPSRKIS